MTGGTKINSISTRFLLFIVVLFPSSQSFNSTDFICPGYNLAINSTREEVVWRAGKPLDLKCPTMTNTSSVNGYAWFYWRESWIKYPWNNATSTFIYFKAGTNNGTLHHKYPELPESGSYICCSYNQDNTLSLQHLFKLKLIDCSKVTNVQPITEPPKKNILVELGENKTLPLCKAYFGCVDEGLTTHRNVYWQYNGINVTNGGRFHVTNDKSLESVEVKSNLTILAIRDSDLKYPYDCVFEKKGQSYIGWSLHLKLKVGDKTETFLEDYWYGVIVVAVVVVIFIIGMVVLYRYHIILFWKEKILSQSIENKHIGILHDVEDPLTSSFINKTLKPELSKYGCTCSVIQQPVPLGETILQSRCEEVSACDAIISVIIGSTSAVVTEDGELHYLMNYALNNKYVVFGILLSKDLIKQELNKAVKLALQKYQGLTILKWVTKPSYCLIQKFVSKIFWCKVKLKLLDMSKKQDKKTSSKVTSNTIEFETFL